MANRYWVGGSGNWSDTSHWSDVSNGSSGFTVPTSSDDVYFDQFSFSVDGSTVSNPTGIVCKNMDWSGITKTVTFQSSGSYSNVIYGNLTLSSKLTFNLNSGTSALRVIGDITTYGTPINVSYIYGSVITRHLDNCTFNVVDFRMGGSVSVSNTWDTNNFNITINGTFTSSGYMIYSFGTSTITCSSNMSFSATDTITGNHTINCGGSFSGNDKTYYDVNLTGTNPTITGANTFTNLTIAQSASTYSTATFNGTQTVNGTLTMNGYDKEINRLKVCSNTSGTQRTIIATNVTASNLDLQDIYYSGSTTLNLSGITGRSQDLGNNSNITFSSGINLYWYSGTGNWNDTTKWYDATNSGGSNGYFPLTIDNVYFDENSFSVSGNTITVNATANCASLNFSGITQTTLLSSSIYSINIYGSLTLPANYLTWTFTSTAYVYFKATTTGNTITMGSTSNRSFNRLYFNGVGGEWINQDDMNIDITNSFIYAVNGTWTTNDKTISFRRYNIGGNSFTLNLGSSTINLRDVDGGTTYTTWTLNAGTSTINATTPSSNQIIIAFKTFYNLILNGSYYIYQNNTFNNLTVLNGDLGIYGNSTQYTTTVNGTFTISGSTNRYMLYSTTLGRQMKIIASNIDIVNCDIRDIIGSGTTWDFSSLEIGDCGGNSGITFRPSENRYWYSGSGNFSDAKWFSETNGGGVSKAMPLPQDIAIFDENSFNNNSTITMNRPRLGTLDMRNINKIVQLDRVIGVAPSIYGDFYLSANNTCNSPSSSSYYFVGRNGNYFIDTKGITLQTTSIGIYSINGKYTLLSDFVGFGWGVAYGTLDLNDFNTTCGTGCSLEPSNNGQILYLGNGTHTCTQSTGSGFDFRLGTLYAEGSTLVLDTLGTTLGIWCNNMTMNNIYFKGSGKTYAISSQNALGNNFNNIKIDQGSTLLIQSGTVVRTNSLVALGLSGKTITISSSTSSQHTLTVLSKYFSGDYLNISYSNATNTLYAGKNSTNGGNNSGWVFDNPPFQSCCFLNND